MDLIKATVGEGGFAFITGIAEAIFLVSFLILAIRKSSSLAKIPIFIGVLFIGIWLTWQLKIPEEKIHILEFAILGWFACRDLIKADKKIKSIIFVLVFILTVGILDEAFQAILPYRVFDWRDIAFNSVGGLWGIGLYLVSSRVQKTEGRRQRTEGRKRRLKDESGY